MCAFVLVLLSSFFWPGHAIYISVLEIDNQQMKVKVFADDLQDAIRNSSKSFKSTPLTTLHSTNRQAIEAYFQEKIKVEADSRIASFSMDQVVVEGDSYWITLRFDGSQKWQSCILQANYLMELFPDQTNVIKVLGNKPQFFRLDRGNTSCSFSL